jgi:hypothetical protein
VLQPDGQYKWQPGTLPSWAYNSETKKLVDEEEVQQLRGEFRDLFKSVNDAYAELINRGREQQAFELRDAAERFARTGSKYGINSWARTEAVKDLEAKMRTAAGVTEGTMTASKLNEQRGILQDLTKLTGMGQESRRYWTGYQQRLATPTTPAPVSAQEQQQQTALRMQTLKAAQPQQAEPQLYQWSYAGGQPSLLRVSGPRATGPIQVVGTTPTEYDRQRSANWALGQQAGERTVANMAATSKGLLQPVKSPVSQPAPAPYSGQWTAATRTTPQTPSSTPAYDQYKPPNRVSLWRG